MEYIPTSLVDILQWRAKNQPDRLAYRFLVDGEFDEVIMTYDELDRRARSIGALLQASTKAGDRALLLYPPGLDFIAAYFGCLYAKVMAIPAYPPHSARLERTLPIVLGFAADARPTVALLTSSLFEGIQSRNEIRAKFGNMKLLATDSEEINDWAEKWQNPVIEGDDIAFLQYTSGSTTVPKGVMVSHRNLLHNMELIERCFGVTSESKGVIWLPPYHDMGLIGGFLQPLYSGIQVTLIPHLMFLQRPFRWLQAISRFGGTSSGGPNFAYDLCVRKIKPEQRELLDLSSWEVAFNGAEPIFHKTLDRFADYFAPCGFRREAFLPCYGFAESTLMVTGGPRARSPVIKHLMQSGIEQNKAIISPEKSEDTREFVSCGQNISDQKILIVNPETLTPCLAGEIGEIWVSGPSVTSGYWNKPLETKATFGARLANSKEGPFVRSGDLGFMNEGELYVTGRIKNLIISGGKNHYPQDIERTVEGSHSAVRPTGSAVFSINNAEEECIIVIAEHERRLVVEAEEVIKAIRKAVSIHHGLHVHDIRLVPPGGVPRTTSGKIRHFLCKRSYMAETLQKSH